MLRREQRVIDAPRDASSPITFSSAQSGTNTSSGHSDRCASVAAAMAALPHDAMASGAARAPGQPERLGGAQVQEGAGEVPALVAPADVAGLVLDPHVGAELRRTTPPSGRTG